MKKTLSTVTLTATLTLISSTAAALPPGVIAVDHNAPGGWENAYPDLAPAISFLRIAGGFHGYDAAMPELQETEFNQRDFRLNHVILSGDIGVPNDDTDNSYHVVTAIDVNITAILDGVVVTGGRADGNPNAIPFSNVGGGILVRFTGDNDVRPAIVRCRFEDNFAATFGGGAAIYSHQQETRASTTASSSTTPR